MTNAASDNAKFLLAVRRNHVLVQIALNLSTYNGLQMIFTDVPILGGNIVVCSKKCVVAAASKDKNGGFSRHS
jgi:hypothetical protein